MFSGNSKALRYQSGVLRLVSMDSNNRNLERVLENEGINYDQLKCFIIILLQKAEELTL